MKRVSPHFRSLTQNTRLLSNYRWSQGPRHHAEILPLKAQSYTAGFLSIKCFNMTQELKNFLYTWKQGPEQRKRPDNLW